MKLALHEILPSGVDGGVHTRGQPLDRTQQWALALAERKGNNKAAVALANKTARRLWAAGHHGTSFDPEHVSRREAHAA